MGAPNPALPLPGCWHLWELWFGSTSPCSLITRVGWPWCSGNGGAGPRDVTILLHFSALPRVNPGLFHWLILAAVRANLDPWLDLGFRADF